MSLYRIQGIAITDQPFSPFQMGNKAVSSPAVDPSDEGYRLITIFFVRKSQVSQL
jgi:hypothetical protein